MTHTTGKGEMMRIPEHVKDIIAYQVAKEWIEMARQLHKEDKRPRPFKEVAPGEIVRKAERRFGKESEPMSRRTLKTIIKMSNHHKRMLVAGVKV